MRRGKTRRLLVVFRAVYHPPVAVFGMRADGQLEESSVRCPEADQIRRELVNGIPYTTDWDERFLYFAERMPRPMTCEVFDVPLWVTPSMLHCLGYLLETLPFGQAEADLVGALRAFEAGEAPLARVKSCEQMIPVAADKWGIVPPMAAILRTFWQLTGQLSKEKLRQLELLELPPVDGPARPVG